MLDNQAIASCFSDTHRACGTCTSVPTRVRLNVHSRTEITESVQARVRVLLVVSVACVIVSFMN